jgi:teichoic acid transport system ATP-binding protein
MSAATSSGPMPQRPVPETSPLAIVVDDLHVRFKVYSDNNLTLRRFSAGGFNGRQANEVHAVKGVSLEVRKGESVGLVGLNGSGKSTLLSAVAGLLPPSSGTVRVRAQPTLLGVGAALKPELSGQRNIVIGALAMGLPMSRINEQLDEVASFTELGEALHRPMRTYSSGMKARLAFSIATMETPEILLIDEALAVGDRKFRAKSLDRVRKMQASAGTILMVTHDLKEIRTTCERALWLDEGQLLRDGATNDVLDEYEAAN